jgi:hypothetical protein
MERNSAAGNGGGFYVAADSTLIIVNTIVVGNAAGDSGGACFAQESSRINMTDGAHFFTNIATQSGGAVCLIEDSQLDLADAVLSGNSAATGGGITLLGSRMSASGASFEHNSATAGSGGALHLSDWLGVVAEAHLTRCTLSVNSAVWRLGSRCSTDAAITARCGGGGAIRCACIHKSIWRNRAAPHFLIYKKSCPICHFTTSGSR